MQDVCQRVSESLTIHCIGQNGFSFRLAIHGPIYEVECAVLLLRLHSQKIKELEEKFRMLSGTDYS